jgi:hypothetical protein
MDRFRRKLGSIEKGKRWEGILATVEIPLKRMLLVKKLLIILRKTALVTN